MGVEHTDRRSAARLVVLICAAQALVQLGAFVWPALLPGMIGRWDLSNSEAGWITAIFYAGYVAAVPILVTLTDRIDAKRIYLVGSAATFTGHLIFAWLADGFWTALLARALAGIGWAGTYMTGLKLLADKVDATWMSRAAAGHAASIGISGALSFAFAELVADYAGWRAAFLCVSATAALAFLLVLLLVPRHEQSAAAASPTHALFDFRPVFRNRSAMAYALAYGFHTLEMSALRGWGVAFLGFVAVGTAAQEAKLSPAMTLTILGLAGTMASVLGNEAAIRLGRRRLITTAMLASAACALALGFFGVQSYVLAAGLILIYGPLVWLDSASLTAGTAGTADPSRRGATLAVHSMLGYIGGFLGPLTVGLVLDLGGGMTATAWASAFAMIAILGVATLIAFLVMRPRGLAGDRDMD